MNGRPENRIEKIVADLLRGRRLKLRGGDAEEKAAITAAARLAGARQGPQQSEGIETLRFRPAATPSGHARRGGDGS